MHIYTYIPCSQELNNGTVFGVKWAGYIKCRVGRKMIIQNQALRDFYLFSDFVLIWTMTWSGWVDHSPSANFVLSHAEETLHFPK